jgi:hypothetical protein
MIVVGFADGRRTRMGAGDRQAGKRDDSRTGGMSTCVAQHVTLFTIGHGFTLVEGALGGTRVNSYINAIIDLLSSAGRSTTSTR